MRDTCRYLKGDQILTTTVLKSRKLIEVLREVPAVLRKRGIPMGLILSSLLHSTPSHDCKIFHDMFLVREIDGSRRYKRLKMPITRKAKIMGQIINFDSTRSGKQAR